MKVGDLVYHVYTGKTIWKITKIVNNEVGVVVYQVDPYYTSRYGTHKITFIGETGTAPIHHLMPAFNSNYKNPVYSFQYKKSLT